MRQRAGTRAYQDITSVSIAESKSRICDQMGQAIVTAEKTLTTVVVKALLGLLDGSLQGQGRGRTGLILLEALVQRLDLILLALGKCLAISAGCQARNVGISCINSTEAESNSESSGSSGGSELLAGLSAANDTSNSYRSLGLDAGNPKTGGKSAPAKQIRGRYFSITASKGCWDKEIAASSMLNRNAGSCLFLPLELHLHACHFNDRL